MYIYNYFIILLGVCVSYDTRFDTIHDTKKSKIDSRYDSWFDNYATTTRILGLRKGDSGLRKGESRTRTRERERERIKYNKKL